MIECFPNRLAATILELDTYESNPSSIPIDHDAWCAAPYRPSLNIIEATERVFAGHDVREISHSTATNLSSTVDAVIRCVAEAQRNRQRVVCFVTGVPAAGKTLAGLSAVHSPALREEGRPSGIFLSGNGPLVKIVRAALVKDLKRRLPESRDGKRAVATFHPECPFVPQSLCIQCAEGSASRARRDLRRSSESLGRYADGSQEAGR